MAITEPYAGSDVANIQCEAKKSEDGKHYIVNGEKKWFEPLTPKLHEHSPTSTPFCLRDP